jgi:hypothetical protein
MLAQVVGDPVKILITSLLLAFGPSLSAQTAPSQPVSQTPDPSQATLKQYRIWTSPFFGISWTVPKGLFARPELENKWEKNTASNPQAITQIMKELHAFDAEDRSHGILLRGDDHDPEMLGRVANTQADAGGRFAAPNIGLPASASRTFIILAARLLNPNVSAADLLQGQTAKLRSQDPSLKVNLTTDPESFAGLQFVHADWKRHDKANDRDMYFRSYVAVKQGYELAFTFSADSSKALDAMCKSMASMTPSIAPAN